MLVRAAVSIPGRMEPEIVSREEELADLHAFLGEPGDGLAAVVLEGEAGIGKSTLWLAGVELARAQGMRVLVSRPAEAERGLGHAALGDLFEDVLDDVLPALAAPRRRALEAAMLLDDGPGDPVDHRALAVAVRDVLQLLAEQGPTLIAVDDVQWLDPASSRALAFALRRLADGPLLLLLARRLVDEPQPSGLEQAIAPERLRRLPVRPLSAGSLHRLLRDRLGRPFTRQTLLRIHERAGGNPFFALELARVLDPDTDPVAPLPVPETLAELVRTRLSGLPPPTREALAIAAAAGPTSESLLRRAGVEADALDPAVAAHVIERERGTIRFTHPLLASVLYDDLGDERESVHGRIAGVVEDPLLRARHLGLSKAAPDPDTAGVLDAAAGVAAGRGASAVAAELAEQALRLTPPDALEERHRRALVAARAHHAAGEWVRARAIASSLLAEAGPGPGRAEALVLLAELEDVQHSVALLEQALDDASARPALLSAVHCRLAWAMRFRAGAVEHAGTALELADELDDDVLRAQARAVQGILGWFAGEGEAPEDLPARARDFPGAVGGEQLVQEATQALVNTSRSEVRALLEQEHAEWRERDEPRAARALWGLAWVEFWDGRWALAAEYAVRAHDISVQYGLEVPQDHLPIAVVAVHRGDLELARAHSQRALALADEQFGLHPPQHLAVLGLAAAWSGEPAASLEGLAGADRQAAALGWGEPSVRWWTGDHVELLLEAGRMDDAVRVLDTWEADARRVAREWVLASVTRCRGLVAAARGDVDQALALLTDAVDEHEAIADPFGRARALLALGVVRRRGRQKRPAREAVEAARDAFESIGAAGWAERARGELGRVGGRTREEGLTAAERRVAVLAAEGRTNKEIAAALFLGERTVSSHLTRVYAKLGLRSRAELARKVQTF